MGEWVLLFVEQELKHALSSWVQGKKVGYLRAFGLCTMSYLLSACVALRCVRALRELLLRELTACRETCSN